MIVAVPAPVGVKTPKGVIVPPVAVQATAELNAPVPSTVAAQADVCEVRMDAGAQTAETVVIVDGVAVTVTVAVPDAAVSCVEVAVMVAVPAPEGTKMPEEVIAPPVAVQVTAGLNVPVPSTVAVQADVCVVKMASGVQTTATEVTLDPITLIVAVPEAFVSCVEIAVIVAIPAFAGVKTPAGVIAPPLTAQA